MITLTIKIKEEEFGAGVMLSSKGDDPTGFEAMIFEVIKASIEMSTDFLKKASDQPEKEEKPEPKPEPRVQDEWVAEVMNGLKQGG